MITCRRLPVTAAAAVIQLYQRTLSPDHGWWSSARWGGRCRYWPSCSEYGRQALLRHGLRYGLVLALWRLGRCHPWSAGGYDPVPGLSHGQRGTVSRPVIVSPGHKSWQRV